jgi:hypothetical protein
VWTDFVVIILLPCASFSITRCVRMEFRIDSCTVCLLLSSSFWALCSLSGSIVGLVLSASSASARAVWRTVFVCLTCHTRLVIIEPTKKYVISYWISNWRIRLYPLSHSARDLPICCQRLMIEDENQRVYRLFRAYTLRDLSSTSATPFAIQQTICLRVFGMSHAFVMQ